MHEPTPAQLALLALGVLLTLCLLLDASGCVERMPGYGKRMASGLVTMEQCQAFCEPQRVHEWVKSEFYVGGSSCECEVYK